MKWFNTQTNKATQSIILALLLILSSQLNAQFGSEPVFKYGAIYARDLVKGPNGNHIYVVYNSISGEEEKYIGEAVGELSRSSSKVMSADYYNAILAQYEKLKLDNPTFELLTKQEFTTGPFVTVNAETITGIKKLNQDTLFVLVIGENQRFSTDGSTLVKMELPINPSIKLEPATKSLILHEDGRVLYQSPENIGFRAAFYGQDNEQSSGDRTGSDTIFGPLEKVSVQVVGNKGSGSTDEQGKYNFPIILPPCPGFFYKFNTNAYAEINYLRFSPRGTHIHPYYMARYDSETCYTPSSTSSFGQSLNGIMQGLSTSFSSFFNLGNMDFPVDLMYLSGMAVILNPDDKTVEVADATKYNHQIQAHERVKQTHNDLDGDGKDDVSVLGKIVTVVRNGNNVLRFQRVAHDASPAPEIQGVWLSSANDQATLNAVNTLAVSSLTEVLPNLKRLPDWKADFEHRGLVSKISRADFRHTDLYVFRESNGKLISERKGLKAEDIEVGDNDGTGVLEGKFFYNMLILGSTEGILNDFGYASTNAEFEQWQKGMGVVDSLHKRQADHLRPGEKVRLIAINRATGYIGTLRTELFAASSKDKGQINFGQISFDITDLEMRPPNLKIWAERYSAERHGLTSDGKKYTQISNEGAGLTDDKRIVILTEWYDYDGSPLPDTLTNKYAFTGRIAQVINNYELKTVTEGVKKSANALSHFAIKPGRHIQVVRTSDRVANKQHFYIQVNANPVTGTIDFGSTQIHDGILEYRPDNYVPFLVPLYDENETNLMSQAYQIAKEFEPLNSDLKKPEPFYHWVYRPEFQFSVYDLSINSIVKTDKDNVETDVTNTNLASVVSSDEKLEIFYNLITSDFPQLDAFSFEGERELVFAFGQDEVKTSINVTDSGNKVEFTDFTELGKLETEDVLSIRLYANNDAANILWQYTQPGIYAYYKVAADEYFIEPDEDESTTSVNYFRTLGGMRLKFYYVPEPGREIVSLKWNMNSNQSGRFVTDFNFSTTEVTAPAIGEEVFWEPNEWAIGLLATGSLDVTYRDEKGDLQPVDTKEFTIASRQLEPQDPPMEGTDVAMLENVLWHLGLSPQYGYAGVQADRIASGTVPDPNGNTDTRRDIYIPGYDFQCVTGASTQQRRVASIEKMVRRFKGLHQYNATSYDDSCSQYGIATGSQDRVAAGDAPIDGIVNDIMLAKLQLQFEQYREAVTNSLYENRKVIPIRGNDSEVNQWANIAISEGWDNDLGDGALYTENYHSQTVFPGSTGTRQDLMREWIEQEGGTAFWGAVLKNKIPKNYRMTMGGADEWGSLGFNQILFKTIYGATNTECPDLTDRSQYLPDKNAENMTIFMSTPTTINPSCGSPLYRALSGISGNPNAYRIPYVNSEQSALNRPRVRGFCSHLINGNAGCEQASFTSIAEDGQTTPDDYEQVAKAIMAYNAGAGTMNTRNATSTDSWIGRLIRFDPDFVNHEQKEHYSIKIRRNAGLLRRFYILQWTITADDSLLNSIPVGHTACFVYGEDDWAINDSWIDILDNLDGINDPRIVNCDTGQ